MGALLPAQVIRRLVTFQISPLECIWIVPDREIGGSDLNLRPVYSDARRTRGRTFSIRWDRLIVDDMLEVEPRIVHQLAGQDCRQPALNVVVAAGVVSPIGRKRIISRRPEH